MAHMFNVDYESVVELFAMISHMSGKQSTGLDLHVFFFTGYQHSYVIVLNDKTKSLFIIPIIRPIVYMMLHSTVRLPQVLSPAPNTSTEKMLVFTLGL